MGNINKKILAVALSFVLGLPPCVVSAGDLSDDIEVVAATNQTNDTTDKSDKEDNTEKDQKTHELVQEEIELVEDEKEIELTESKDDDKEHSDKDTDEEETDANKELEVLKPVRVVVESEDGFPANAELDVEYPDATEWLSLLPADEWFPAFAIRFSIKDQDDDINVGRMTVRIYKDESELSGKYLYHITDKAESMSFTSNLEYTQFSGEPGLFVFVEKVVQEEKELVDTDSEDIGAYSTGQIGFDSEIDENNTEENSIENITDDKNTEEENNSIDDNSNVITNNGQIDDTDEHNKYQEDHHDANTWTWSNDDVSIVIYGDDFTDETFDIRMLDEDEMNAIAVNPTMAFELNSSISDTVSFRLSNVSDQSLFFVSGESVEEIPYIAGDELLFTSRMNGIFVFADSIRFEHKTENDIEIEKTETENTETEEIEAENKEFEKEINAENDNELNIENSEELSTEGKQEEIENDTDTKVKTENDTEENEDANSNDEMNSGELSDGSNVNDESNETQESDTEENEGETSDAESTDNKEENDEEASEENTGNEDETEKDGESAVDDENENGLEEEQKEEEKEAEKEEEKEEKDENEEEKEEADETEGELKDDQSNESGRLAFEGDDYKVTIDCADALISDGVLTVTESEHLEDRNTLLQELDATILPYVRFFDLSITDAEGNAVELPDATVSVELPDALSGENVRTIVYADGIVESNDEDGVISFDLGNSLSFGVVKYYTVDFYYGENEYHLSGGGRISLDELFDGLGIEQDANDVLSATFSNDEYLTVGDESNGWTLESIKPFTSEERLAVVTNELESILITCNYREIDVVESQADEETYEDGELFVKGDDYEVSVTYTADARIPVGSSLDVREIVGDEYHSYANETMGLYDEATNLPYARFFDITILSPDGEVIEPENGVSVSIRLMDEKPEGDNVETTAVHFAEETSGADETTVTDESNGLDGMNESVELIDNLNASVEQMDVTVDGDTVEFEAESFSVYGVVCYYTVDFYYGDAEYHLSGGGNMTLSELFEKLGIERSVSDVESVEFTDYNLLNIAGAEDEYRITSIQPFQTSEELTVTMTDGEVIRIRTEDDIASGTYDGIDWRITDDGILVLGKQNRSQTMTNSASRTSTDWPWYSNRSQIKEVSISGTIVCNGSLTGMFYGCSGLKSLDLESFMTVNVTNMSDMFSGCSNLSSVKLGNYFKFDGNGITSTSSKALLPTPTGTSYTGKWIKTTGGTAYTPTELQGITGSDLAGTWVWELKGQAYAVLDDNGVLTFLRSNTGPIYTDPENHKGTITDIASPSNTYTGTIYSGIETINPTSSNYSTVIPWYSQNSLITSVQVANGQTVRPISTSYWFSDCSSLASANFTGFDTANVTNMSYMFQNCNRLTSLDLSKFNTEKVTTMNSMFYYCNRLKILNVSNFNTSKVTSMFRMFFFCSSLTSLDINSFNTGNVLYMDNMFAYCSGLTSLNLSKFNTANVKNMSFMFQNCNGLTSLDLSKFNTENVKDMSYMFYGCSGLTSLDVSKFNTANVTNMSYMFYGCSSLTSLTLPNSFNTSKVTFMGSMFSSCSGLISLDLSNFNTSNVTNMGSIFWGCSGLTSLDLSKFNTANVTNMESMFSGCSNLSSVKLGEYFKFDGNGITSTSSKALLPTPSGEEYTDKWIKSTGGTSYTAETLRDSTTIDLAGTWVWELKGQAYAVLTNGDANYLNGTLVFFRSNNTYTNKTTGTFTDIVSPANTYTGTIYSGIETINNSRTSNSPWYSQRSSITSVQVANGQIIKPINTSYWFYECSNLTSADFTGFDTSSVTNMNYMFGDCSGLTSLTLPDSFDTSNVTDISYMFRGCSGLTSLNITFNTAKVTDMRFMFKECSGLTSLDLSGFNTANVTNMGNMFYGCSSLTALNLSSFNTSNVTDMGEIFSGCSGLTSLDLSRFNTANVTNMNQMFSYCSKLTSLTLPDSIDTSNVTNMSYMFYRCSGLTSLDLSHFNTGNVLYMDKMFYNCSKLSSVKLGEYFKFDGNGITAPSSKALLPTPSGTSYTGNWKRKEGGYVYTAANLRDNYNGSTMAGTWEWELNGEAYAVLDSDGVLTFFRSNASPEYQNESTGTFTDIAGNTYTGTIYSEIETINPTSSNYSSVIPWYSQSSSITSVQVANGQIVRPINTAYWFYDCQNLTSYDCTGFDTANVTDMSSMFGKCSGLTTLNVSSFNTSNVTNMGAMFSKCSGLTTLNVSSFNTSNVTTMLNIFNGCSGLTSLNVSSFNTSNVTSMVGMFSKCSGLTSLDLSSFNTGNVTNMNSMFYYCSGLTSLNLSNFNTANVTDMGDMFSKCSDLSSLDLSKFNTANVTNMYGMFSGCSGLTNLSISFNTRNVTSMSSMFERCSGLTSLDLSNFNTANVMSMSYVFYGCSSLTSLNLSSFNTANVTSMGYMFSGCENLSSVKLGEYFKFDGNGITSASSKALLPTPSGSSYTGNWIKTTGGMAYTPTGLQGVTGSNLAGKWVWELKGQAYAVLTNGDANYLNGTLVFFRSNESYTNGETGTFTDIASPANTYTGTIYSGIETINNSGTSNSPWYSQSSSITSVQLANGQIVRPINISYWFYYCTNLTSTDTDFTGFDTSNVTNMRGMFYGCSSLTSLTLPNSFNTSSVTNMNNMFNNCSGLTSLTLPNSFDTANVTDMWNMFRGCSSLTSLDLSSFDTAKVTNMKSMFYNCNNLSSLNVSSNFDTANVTSMQSMFYRCSSLTSLDLSSFDTRNVTDMNGMFSDCYDLLSLNLSNFNTRNVTDMNNMFYGCSSLTSLDLSSFNTAKVTNMQSMFYNCNNLSSLNVSSNFDTANVTKMDSMFYGCSSLTSLDLSNFNTAKVTNMRNMFSGCSKLSSVKLGEYFKFDGKGITSASSKALLPTPSGSSYTGNWIKTTGGTAYTPTELQGKTGSDLAGTWVWEEKSIIDITLDDNGGLNGSGTIYSNYGDGIYLTNNEGTLSNQMTASSNPVTIPTKAGYTVTFSANGGSSSGTAGDTMTSSGVFGGYYDNSSTPVQMIDSTGHITASLTPTYTEATTLTASWTNGSITLPTPTRTGYTSTGWYSGNTWIGNAGDSYTPIAAETLTAGWEINTYALNIKNTTTGSMGDKTKEFSFTLALTGTDLPSTLDFTKNGTTGTATLTNDKCNFTLAHDDQITFNVPYNTGYTITEISDGYTVVPANDTGTIATSPITATFTNTLNKTVETGVENHNQLIFMLILMSLGAIMITVEERKRRKRIEERIVSSEKDDENRNSRY